MRFRRIEKSGGMANVGLKDQHIQGKEDDVTTANSKTYIGSKGKQKLAMNKIKNTKIGDDIHYYINGMEGRGIVVKMANEYLEVFKEDGQLGTIHINDTFFVKDILVNKQWDEMDDIERYDALTKIHAPSPRYITKQWNDIPEEIKILLQKDLPRTDVKKGWYQDKKDKEALGRHPVGSDADLKQKERERRAEEKIMQQREQSAKDEENMEDKDRVDDKKISAEEQARLDKPDPNNPRFTIGGKHIPKKDQKKKAFYEQWLEKKVRRPNPRRAGGSFGTTQSAEGQQVQADQRAATASAAGAIGGLFSGGDAKTAAAPTGTGANEPGNKPSQRKLDEQKELDDSGYSMSEHDWIKNRHTREGQADEANYGWAEGKWEGEDELTSGGKKTGKKDSIESYSGKKGTKQSTKTRSGNLTSRPSTSGNPPKTISGDEKRRRERHEETTQWEKDAIARGDNLYEAFSEDDDYYKHLSAAGKKLYHEQEAKHSKDNYLSHDDEDSPPKASKKSRAFRKLKPVYEGDTKEAKDTQKAFEVWLERRDKSEGKKKKKKPRESDPEAEHSENEQRNQEEQNESDINAKRDWAKHNKSDVEHGKYSNPGGTPEVGVSTDTKVDVTTGTGYEERPHISVEEAGKLPRSTFNESGSELTVSGSQDSKDEPKFSQPADQEQPVRKAGLPQQHPNTYGVRYGMKGGVKKVWCPEHQVWEETRKDWHE